MRLALTQLMLGSNPGSSLFRRLFCRLSTSCCCRFQYVSIDQHSNMVSLLQQLIQEDAKNAAFEGSSMDCPGAGVHQATQSGLIEVNGEKITPALRGNAS